MDQSLIMPHEGIYDKATSRSFADILIEKSNTHPHQTAYTFLVDGEREEWNITYAQLHQQAIQIAHYLQTICVPGDRAILAFHPGIDFITAFYGCLCAGIIAVPAVLPKSQRAVQRLHGIMEDAGAAVILSHTSLSDKERNNLTHQGTYRLVLTNSLPPQEAPADLFRPAGHNTAFIQYTSGSTSAPKGVEVTHENILENVALIARVFRQQPGSTIVSWLPYYHDMGLVGGILVPLFVGARGVLLSPIHFIQKPIRWLQAISTYQATTSGGPNFGFELCANAASTATTEAPDLTAWKVAFTGAELVRHATLQRFSDTFRPFGFNETSFQPCYGMAEATLLITAGQPGKQVKTALVPTGNETSGSPTKHVVSCGPALDFDLCIIDQQGHELPDGATGEILAKGKSIARGYWQKKALTEAVFNFYTSSGNGPYLRTGDLGFIRDGELYVTGRLKELIILNGRNYYPQDIESTLTDALPELVPDGCAAVAQDNGTQETLVIIAELKSGYAPEEMLPRIKAIVFEEFGIAPARIALIRKGTLPKTTSGKIQRYACLATLEAGKLSVTAEWTTTSQTATGAHVTVTEVEAQITQLLTTLTNTVQARPEDHIFAAGLNSIQLAQLVMHLNEQFDIALSMDFIFENPSIRAIAQEIEALQATPITAPLLQPIAQADAYALSPTQHGIWFDQQLKNRSNSYQIPVCVTIHEPLNEVFIHTALNELIENYEILRTSFPIQNGKPVQVVARAQPVAVQKTDMRYHTPEAIQTFISEQAALPFDLAAGPLLRAGIVQTSDTTCKLFIIAHHIIADGTALLQLVQELLHRHTSLQQQISTPIALPDWQYKDYTHWANQALAGSQSSAAYWRNLFSNGVTPFLSYDPAAQVTGSSKGRTALLHINQATAAQINALALQQSSTTYVMLLSAFAVMLFRQSGKKEIIIGIPVSGRTHTATQHMPGVFINAIMMPLQASEHTTFSELAAQVKTALFNGLKHQSYPLHMLAKDLNMTGSTGQPAFTSVFFNGLGFIGKQDGRMAAEAFADNFGLDMNLDLNTYVLEHDEGIQIRLDYKEAVFSPNGVNSMLQAYEQILLQSVAEPDFKVWTNPAAQILSQEALLQRTRFATGTKAVVQPPTIIQLFEQQAAAIPGHTAIVYGIDEITYGTLQNQVNALAAQLQAAGVQPGMFVPVLMTKSITLPLTILALMKLGAPFVPMDTGWPEERLHLLSEQLSPLLVLVNEDRYTTLGSIPCMRIDHNNIPATTVAITTFIAQPSDPIYGMYTSGTTGIPKCAVNLHQGINNRFAYMNKVYGCHTQDVILFTSRHIYDASVWQMFWPLTNGAKMVIPDDTYGLDLHEIAGLIARQQVTITDFVPSVFSLFVDYLETAPAYAAKVKTLRQLLIGGEAMNAGAVKRFRRMHPAVGITNTYGPTEASIGTIFYEVPETIPDIIPIGQPIDNVIALLLDETLTPVAEGTPGDLYLGGICLGTGYLGDAAKTAEVFIPNPIATVATQYLYKTGDIAACLPDGNLQFFGRKDSQVKINGIRVECGEIENTLLQQPSVIQAVISCRQDSSGKHYLVGILKLKEGAQLTEIHQQLKKQLPVHMVPVGYAVVTEIPITLNGKADRKKLADLPWQKATEQGTTQAETREHEQALLDIWQQVLDQPAVTVHDNFFESGGDSLKAMQLLTRVHQTLHAGLTLAEIFHHPTVAALAQILNEKQFAHYNDITPVAEAPFYELSHAQRRLWVLSKFPGSAAAYHMPSVTALSGKLNVPALAQSFHAVSLRHESLRTTFIEHDGIPFQHIAPNSLFQLEQMDCRHQSPGAVQALVNNLETQPFDLEKGPLLRATLIHTNTDHYLLVLVMHHIISDAWSMEVLLKELLFLYRAFSRQESPSLPATEVQYKDYATWQHRYLQSEAANHSRAYWQETLSGRISPLQLPCDFARPQLKTYNGATLRVQLPAADALAFRQLCSAQHATTFIGLITVVSILLHRYTASTDIIMGTPVAGRNHRRLENQLGLYVNTIPLYNRIDPDNSFIQLLQQSKQTVIAAYEHQAYPFDSLVDELAVPRDSSRNPLFDVLVAMLDYSAMEKELAAAGQDTGLQLTRHPSGTGTSKFDLYFNFTGSGDQLLLDLEYNTDLFLPQTIERIGTHFTTLLHSILAATNAQVALLNLIPEPEQLLLASFNNTMAGYDHTATLSSLFEAQAAQTPHQTALVFAGNTFTYQALNEQANRLAHYLIHTHQVMPQDLVCVALERSEQMIVALLAILKSGAAYVPVDPAYPEERITYIRQDSNSSIMIDNLFMEQFGNIAHTLSAHQPGVAVLPHHLAYVIYTSGSTGKPKGCMLEHQGVVNRIAWMWQHYGYSTADVILQKTTYTFDVSVWEIFMPLCYGAQMVLCQREDTGSPERILQLIHTYKVTCLHFVPSLLHVFIQELLNDPLNIRQMGSLQKVMTSGEKLMPDMARQWYQATGLPIHNLYGPTEASVDVSYYTTSGQETNIPIGRPIWNTQLYILDAQLQYLPVGIAGEICISGDGLARGYLGRPALTAEKFVDHPFIPEQKMYRTGDIGKWLPDGNIEYIGRKDAQVKIRGFRIEPGEIEAALLTCHGIQEAVVIACEKNNEKYLVAYMVSDIPLEPVQLREQLGRQVPAYMIPAYFVRLDKFPLTPSGKTDRNALPDPATTDIHTTANYTAPRNDTERRLERIWCEVLQITQAGVHDDFFSLGGHSLMAARIISRVRNEFNTELPFAALFNNATIAGLSQLIADAATTDAAPAPKIKRIERVKRT